MRRMDTGVHAGVPLRVGKKMRKRRELDALVGGGASRTGRLLSASSDEGEPWARRSHRRRKARPFVRLAAVLAVCVCVVSATTVLWLFVDVRKQIVGLRRDMDKVSQSTGGVTDALQAYHTVEHYLRGNATELRERIDKLEHQYAELAQLVNDTSGQLKVVSGQLSAASSYNGVSTTELVKTIGNFGSQIKSLETSLKSAHDQVVLASSGLTEVRGLLHDVDQRSNDTAADVANFKTTVEHLADDLHSVNSTLVGKIDGVQNRIDATTPTTPATTTASSTTQSTTTTVTQPPNNVTAQAQPAIKPVLTTT